MRVCTAREWTRILGRNFQNASAPEGVSGGVVLLQGQCIGTAGSLSTTATASHGSRLISHRASSLLIENKGVWRKRGLLKLCFVCKNRWSFESFTLKSDFLYVHSRISTYDGVNYSLYQLFILIQGGFFFKQLCLTIVGHTCIIQFHGTFMPKKKNKCIISTFPLHCSVFVYPLVV